IGQELWPAVRDFLLCLVELRSSRRLSTGRRYPRQTSAKTRREENDAVAIPCAPARIRGITKNLHGSALCKDGFQFCAGKESDVSPIRGPEGTCGSLGADERPGGDGLERSHPDSRTSVTRRCHKGETTAVRRDGELRTRRVAASQPIARKHSIVW